MKPPNRIPLVAAALAGALLVAFGLFLGPDDSMTPQPEAIDRSDAAQGRSAADSGEERLSRPKRAADAAASQDPRPSPGAGIPDGGISAAEVPPASVLVEVAFKGESMPAAGARVSLWREQTGEGTAFRPARRIAQVDVDSEGRASLSAAPNEPLEIYAQAAGAGLIERRRIGALEPDETRQVRIEIERPPTPMDLSVRAAGSGEPVPGAAIRIVMTDQANLGIEEFPGTTKLVQRTDGNGRASLPGPVRRGSWLLVDAAGFSPTAINLRSLDGLGTPEVLLERAGKIEALVVNGAGDPMVNIEIQFSAHMDGFRTMFTAQTNRRGKAKFARLPASIPLVPQAGLVDETPTLFDAVTLKPGEQRTLSLNL